MTAIIIAHPAYINRLRNIKHRIVNRAERRANVYGWGHPLVSQTCRLGMEIQQRLVDLNTY